MGNIYTYNRYFQDYLDQKGVDLTQHIELRQFTVDIDHKRILDWAEENVANATVKDYKPRPFVPEDSLRQSVMTQYLGYNEHNTTEINWGIEPEDDQALKVMVGSKFFEAVNLEESTSLVRLLRYDPGQGIPIHTDSYNGFKVRFGEGDVRRFFVAISEWSWGHFLQVHDNMFHHWIPGDCIEIPNEVFHLSANFGILPKYTLTVTGFDRG